MVTDPRCDLVVVAIPSARALPPTLAALHAGKEIALATKEVLVMAGDLVMRAAGKRGIRPVDSEHSAIWQCLWGEDPESVRRLIITASGGPFWAHPDLDLDQVTVEQALNHPRWSMGPKITVDSATLMNKGLEVIEAHHLFAVDLDAIGVVIHPQSVVHSLVEFVDGSLKAQLGRPDMRLPIAVALATLTGSPDAVRADTDRGAERPRVPRPRREPVPERPAGPGGRQSGARAPGRPQRGQRGGRDRLPGRGDPLQRDRARS